MTENRTGQQAEHLPTPALMRLAGKTLKTHIRGNEQLTPRNVILAVRSQDAVLLQYVLENSNPAREVYLTIPTTGNRTLYESAKQLREGQDIIALIDAESSQAHLNLIDTLRLARGTHRDVFPVGVSTSKSRLTRQEPPQTVPLPGTRVVVYIEAPFIVPEQPESIPDTWLKAVNHRLERASGQARDILATWQKHKRL